MLKVYCDICGKEIKKSNEVWGMSVFAHKGNPRMSYCVGWMRISLSLILPCSIPLHLKVYFRTAEGKEVQANSQSAKSLFPVSLSHTIQQLESNGIRDFRRNIGLIPVQKNFYGMIIRTARR